MILGMPCAVCRVPCAGLADGTAHPRASPETSPGSCAARESATGLIWREGKRGLACLQDGQTDDLAAIRTADRLRQAHSGVGLCVGVLTPVMCGFVGLMYGYSSGVESGRVAQAEADSGCGSRDRER